MGKPAEQKIRKQSKEREEGGARKTAKATATFKSPLIELSIEDLTWYDYGRDLPGRNDTISSLNGKERKFMTPDLIRRFRSMADSFYQNEMVQFSQKQDRKTNSDDRWVENTMRKGTLKDRIAAMSVTVSSDPIHKFYALEGLLSMVGCSSNGGKNGGKANSRVAQLAAEALDDLFINIFLPSNRKLLTLSQRPLCRYECSSSGSSHHKDETTSGSKQKKSSHKTLSPKILLLWRFEEMIKEKYDLYLRQYMVQTLQDGAEQQKVATLQSAARLLSSVPEGEAKLLDMMVNKIGDPDKKTAAAAGHQLRTVLQSHPNMQTVIAREVQQLAHRPRLSPKALYNCIVFLNQLQLKRPEIEQCTIDHDEEKQNKNSVTHQSSTLPASLIKTYFRLFEVAVHQKDKHSSKASKSTNDDAGAMKGRLLSALLTGVNRAHPYLPEKDQDMEEHIDALYRIVHKAPPGACTQALMLLFHLAVGFQLEKEQKADDESPGNNHVDKNREDSARRKKLQDRFYRALYATLAKSNIVCRGKHLTMYFNLLYKVMKYDKDTNRVYAFAKRLLTSALHAPPATMAASMCLLQEISKTHNGLRLSWEDILDPSLSASLVLDDSKREPKAGIVHMRHLGVNGDKDAYTESLGPPPCWELSLIAHHFHPSVTKFANDIGEIDYAGDPLLDFGLAPFLDKFAYRNPKSREKLLQQYRQAGFKGAASSHSRRMKRLEARLELPMNDQRLLERNDVNEQDEFFHRFFVERARRDEIKGITRHHGTDEPDVKKEDEDEWIDNQEQRALDAAEEADVDLGLKTFEEYEAMWEADEEEEAFVDSLATQLLEDAAGGPADIDDDPDMEDWEDMYDDEEDDDKDTREEDNIGDIYDENANSDSDEVDFPNGDDAVMELDEPTDDSESDDSGSEPEVDESAIVGGWDVERLDQGSTGDCDDGSQAHADDINEMVGDDDDEDEEFRMSKLADDSDDDKEPQGSHPKTKRRRSKSKDPSSIFADADEYAEMIERSFRGMKRTVSSTLLSEEAEPGLDVKPRQHTKKRRKREEKAI
jgi:ribosome biogenesis protein MAK21